MTTNHNLSDALSFSHHSMSMARTPPVFNSHWNITSIPLLAGTLPDLSQSPWLAQSPSVPLSFPKACTWCHMPPYVNGWNTISIWLLLEHH